MERLRLAEEALEAASTTAEVQEVRADLKLLRTSVGEAGAWSPRSEHSAAWSLWQATNQAAWEKLSSIWSTNEQRLHEMLDSADDQLKQGSPRAAKEQIKAFHTATRTHECSHQATKRLRIRAHALWDAATAAAKERHEAYLTVARRRLEHLHLVLHRAEEARERVEDMRVSLEEQLSRSETEIAAALLRRGIEEHQRELRRIAGEVEELRKRIADTEAILA